VDLSNKSKHVEWGSGVNDTFLSVGAAARLAGVSVDTIRRWCSQGRLPYNQGGPNNHRRVMRGDLLALLSGEAPSAPRGTARRHLPQMIEAWVGELHELLPWRPGPLDDADRIARMLVTLHGYSVEAGRGGLMGSLLELEEDMKSALRRFDEQVAELDDDAFDR
jgi:excisionase family DNA binding protein